MKFFCTKIYHTKVSLHENFQIYSTLILQCACTTRIKLWSGLDLEHLVPARRLQGQKPSWLVCSLQFKEVNTHGTQMWRGSNGWSRVSYHVHVLANPLPPPLHLAHAHVHVHIHVHVPYWVYFLQLSIPQCLGETWVMSLFGRIKSAVVGNPVTKEYELGRHIASAGPGLMWKVYSAAKKSTRQVRKCTVLTCTVCSLIAGTCI